MRKLPIALALVLCLFLAIPIVSAYSLWWENWSQDNIVVVGNLSTAYWLRMKDDSGTNVTFSYRVANGFLNINSTKTGSISATKDFQLARKIDLTNITKGTFEVRFKATLASNAYLNFKIWKNDLTIYYVTLQYLNQQLQVFYWNSTNQIEYKTISTISAGDWCNAKIEIDNRTITVSVNGSIKAILSTTKNLKDYNAIAITHYVVATTSNTPSSIYIDYIGLKTQIFDPSVANPFIQLTVTIAMLAVALALLKKAT